MASPAPAFSPGAGYILRYGTALILLVSAAILFGRTVRVAREHPSVLTAPTIQPFADPAERDRRLRDVVGTFATGSAPGDRMIVVQPDGHVRFYPLGPLREALEISDAFRIGRRNGHTWLITAESGVIEALDIDRLAYFDDEYRRTK